MDGAVAQSMRNKGVNYHINWGIPVTRLKEMAAPYGKDYDLAIELWKENIRECKILATLIMPVEQMLPEVVDIMDGANSIARISRNCMLQLISTLRLCSYVGI